MLKSVHEIASATNCMYFFVYLYAICINYGRFRTKTSSSLRRGRRLGRSCVLCVRREVGTNDNDRSPIVRVTMICAFPMMMADKNVNNTLRGVYTGRA